MLGDNAIPEDSDSSARASSQEDIDSNSVEGFKPSKLGLYETAGTINDSWGFSYHDQNWKSLQTIHDYKAHLNKYGITYLLNVGLDGLGHVPMTTEQAPLGTCALEA